MFTEAVTAPDDGLNPVIVGDGKTVKSESLLIITPVPATRTEIGPVEAPAGTWVVSVVVVEAETMA